MHPKLPNTFVVQFYPPHLCSYLSICNYLCDQELDALARDWAKPPPDALFSLRVPIDYVHIQTAVRSFHTVSCPRSPPTAASRFWRLCLCMLLSQVLHLYLTEP
jgi:hypothetical protein